MSRTLSVAWSSLAVSVVVLAIKFAAYWVTGSIALYSDALETVINVVAAAGAVIAVRVGERPPDANHPYGHQKAEYLSAVVEGALVLATALLIGHEAWKGFQDPHPPDGPVLGMALNAAAGVINLVWALLLIRKGRLWKSPALVAGGRHIMTDVWTTGAVLVGFALVPLTGRLWIDPAVAGLVALNILWAGYGVVRDSVGGLMDEVADPAVLANLRRIIAEQGDGAIEAHDVRTRSAGAMTFVEFHLVVPGRMAVEDAHAICDRIETAMREQFGSAVINIHVEPENKAKHRGIVVIA